MNNRLKFGKHKGKTIDQIRKHDPSYVVWLRRENVVPVSDEEYNSALSLNSFNRALRKVTPSMGFLKDFR